MRGLANAEGPLHSVDPEPSHPSHEQLSALLGSDQIHSPLFEDGEEDHAREISTWTTLPWWKRPSPYWVIFGTSITATAFSALVAPRVALYTTLACRVHRPEYVINGHSLYSFIFPSTNSLVQAVDTPIPYIFGGSVTIANTFSALLPNPTYVSWVDSTESELDPEQKCASDPIVQAVVAKFNAVFNTSMGILSCLTAGWWGSLSDHYGRRTVLFVSVFGLLACEFTHVITAWFVDVLPGGYWFPLVGFLIEGLCGSISSGGAAANAYLADTIGPSTRSRYFSLSLGLAFTGVAVGPVIGGLLIRSTGTTLSVFYFAIISHGVYALLVLLVFPESLTRARARGTRLRWERERASQAPKGRVLDVLKNVASPFKPLVVLLPEEPSGANLLKQKRRDWSLFFLAIACALVTSVLGSVTYKFQYAAAQFSWTPEITSYYVSFIGVTRALFLAVVLPLIIKYFKTSHVQLPSTPEDPLRGSISSSPSCDTARANASEQRLPASRSSVFDLALARVSTGVDAIAFLGMAAASTGTLFALASTVNSLGAGFGPAAQALALDIYTNYHTQNRGELEVGKLFGALGVLQALGSQIITPALYGFVYYNTVSAFPQAIMIMSTCTSLLALVFLLFVRIPSELDRATPGNGDEVEGAHATEILLGTEHQIVEGH